MTPNEIYGLPSTNEKDWRDLGLENIQMVFGVSGYDYNSFEGRYPVEEAKIVVSDKLYFYEDSDRGTSIRTLSFDGRPFALFMSAGEDGSDQEDVMVTDERIFGVAKQYVLDHLVELTLAKKHNHDVRDPATYDFLGYHNAMFARVGEEVRFVDPLQCRRTDGRLIFDVVALREKFDELLRPQIDIVRTQGLADDARRQKAIQVLRAAIPADLKVVEIDRRNDRGDWIALAYSDGVDAMTLVADKGEFSTFHWLDVGPKQVGPASVLTAIESHMAGFPINAEGSAAAGIAETFNCTPLEAVQALDNWAADMSSDLCSVIVDVIGAPPPVGVQDEPLYRWKVHAYVAAHPEAAAYCLGGYPSVKQAKEIVASVEERRACAAQKAISKTV
jgi:hypothetical protein